MSSIDERIVSMQFDNDQFEKGVGTTLKSLTNLEKSVDGLNGLNTNPLLNTLDTVSDRFSSLGIVGMTVIQNLTNRFVDMGVKMAKSLTIDQVAAGFDKYTANTKTVKALLNSTGETIDVVTEKINGLSWYSDATSYSYNAMVSALKSFTAQDIKMDEAIPAIMGIGNSLSYAGLAAEEASSAFDIYSKAMGQGYLSNIQLKSLNNMGAVTAQWKQQMLDAAVAEGTLKKVGDGLYRTNQGLNVSIKEFDMTLGHQKGKWLTREVMMRVFGQVYGDYTQRLQAFMAEEENAGLTIDQAIKKFNELNGITEDFGLKAFKSAQEARTFSEAVGAVRDAASSAWRGIFENVFGNAEEATEMWTAFSDWLYDVFMGPSEMMYNLTTEWRRLGGREGMLQGFANLAEALHSVAEPIRQAFHAVFGELNASTLGAALKDLTDKFAAFTEKLKLDTPTYVKVRQIAQGFFSLLSIGKTVLEDIGSAAGKVLEHFKPLGGKLLDTAASIGKYITEHRALAKAFIRDNGLISGFTEFILKLAETVENAKPLEWIFTNIKNLADSLWQKLKEVGGQLKETFNPIMDGKISFENILKLIATLGGAQAIKVTIFDRLKNLGSLPKDFGKGISTALKTVADSMREFGMVDISADQMKNIAIALAILAASLFVIASIDTDRLMSGILGMGVLIKYVEGLLNNMAKLSGGMKSRGKLAEVGIAMVAMGAALLILAVTMKKIGELDFGQIVKGLIGLGAVMLEMSLFIKSMKGIKVNKDGAFALILVATAMLIMSKGVSMLGKIPINELKQGLLAIAAILAEIAVFSRFVQPEGLLKTSFSMVVLGAAVLIMYAGISKMGKLPFEVVLQGLVGIAAGLTIFGVALELIPSNLGAAASIGVLALAMIPLAVAFKILSTIPLEGIGKGLLAVIPTLGAAFVLFKFLNPGATIAIAAAFAILAVALNLLIPPFLAFGHMKLTEIGKALLVIGGSIAIFGVAATLLSAAIVPMLGLAAAMALFGLGVSAFAIGIATLAASGTAATAAFIGSIALWLTAIPMLGTLLVNAVIALIEALCKALIVTFPTLLDTVGQAIDALLEFLLLKVPLYVEQGSLVAIAFLDGLAAKLPELVEAAVNFITVFITSLATSLETHKDELIEGIDNLILTVFDIVWGAITGLIKGIGERIPEIWSAAVEFIGGFLMGIVEKGAEINGKMNEIIDKAGEAIAEKWEEVKQWGIDIWNKIKEGFTNAIDNAVSGVKSIGKALLNGLGFGLDDEGAQSSLLAKVGGIAGKILGKFRSIFSIASPSKATAEMGKFLMSGLAYGIVDNEKLPMKSAVKASTDVIESFRDTMGIHSDSDEMIEEGGYLMSGLATGIDENEEVAEDSAENAAENIMNAFDEKMRSMLDDLENDVAMNPEITPLINLDKFYAGLDEMKTAMGDISDSVGAEEGNDLDKWSETYKAWKAEAMSTYGWIADDKQRVLAYASMMTDELAYGSSEDGHVWKYGQGTIDLVNGLAAGLLGDDAREYLEKFGSDAEKARYTYIINQKNMSPKALDSDEIHRNTESAIRSVATAALGLTPGYNNWSPSQYASVVLNS